jgi:Ca2+-binding RTX toxin-like protein
MTAIRIQGIAARWDGAGTTTFAGIGDIFFVLEPGAPSTFDYEIVETVNGLPAVIVDVDVSDVIVVFSDGGVYDLFTDDLNSLLLYDWFRTEDRRTVLLEHLLVDGTFFFDLGQGGDPLPVVTDIIDYEDLLGSGVSTAANTDPNFEPGDITDLLDIPGATIVMQGIAGQSFEASPGVAANLLGTGDDDTLLGDTGRDRLDGGLGNDLIRGGEGQDAILGRSGGDVLFGEGGNDTIAADVGDDNVWGGEGNDSLGGGDGDDRVFGGAGNDVIGGGTGNDLVDAGAGDDNTSGGYGADSVYGGNGDDTMAGSFGNDLVIGGTGNDSLGGGTGRDSIYGYEDNDIIGGGDDDDLIFGHAGNDTLNGGGGNDDLYGGDDNDVLNGGGDADTMTGGSGSDVFQFNRFVGTGTARITDFEDGVDLIRFVGLAGNPANAFAALTITQGVGGVQIVSVGPDILIAGVTLSQITSADFLFV